MCVCVYMSFFEIDACAFAEERAKRYVYIPYLPCAATGWRRPIGCLKLQVIVRKRANFNRALLRKMTYNDKASYDSTPPAR